VAGRETYEEGILVGYRWFDTKKIEPEFPFGFGLSYTTFAVSGLKVEETEFEGRPRPTTPLMTVEATVTNTGDREGAEVVQVYVEPVAPSLPRPVQELKGFKKVMLKAGEKTTVSIPLDAMALSYYDPAKQGWVAEAGDFRIQVGTSSRDVALAGTFKLGQTIVTKETK
jgi:beta-glucosidase